MITSSGLITLSGWINGKKTDATISLNGELKYTNTSGNAANAAKALREALNLTTSDLNSTNTKFYNQDLKSSISIAYAFGTSSSGIYGDGTTNNASRYSWLNESVFQWLEGEKGWNFYAQ